MMVKEAREIVTQFKEGRFIFDDVHPNAKAYFLAEGFLEASKAAEPLLEVIEKQERALKELADHFNSVMGFARSLDGRFWEGNPAYWGKLIKTPSDLVTKAAELLLKAIEKVTEDDYCLNPSFTNSLNAYGDDVIEDVIPCETCEVCKLRDALEKYKKEVLGE